MTETGRSALAPDSAGTFSAVVERTAVTRLSVTEFRSYGSLKLDLDTRPVVLTGSNGVGKTNLLEAISFLTPGRGLRRARLAEIGRRDAGEEVSDMVRPWAVAAQIALGEDCYDIGTGCAPDMSGAGRDKRTIKINGEAAKSQSALGRLVAMQWLTPHMDRLFVDAASGRRRFIDRMIMGLDPEHAGPVSAYEHALRSRNRLLKDGVTDSHWLASVEDSMVRHGVAVAARRLETIERLRAYCLVGDGPFPDAKIDMTGELETWLQELPALAVEDRFRDRLAASRQMDAVAASAVVGPHRSDLTVHYAGTGRAAEECSTGEQKGLLITLVLAAARMQAEERGYVPLLLLDEVVAHLDAQRRAALFDRLRHLGAQAWMTGTDAGHFEPWGSDAQFLTVTAGTVLAQTC